MLLGIIYFSLCFMLYIISSVILLVLYYFTIIYSVPFLYYFLFFNLSLTWPNHLNHPIWGAYFLKKLFLDRTLGSIGYTWQCFPGFFKRPLIFVL